MTEPSFSFSRRSQILKEVRAGRMFKERDSISPYPCIQCKKTAFPMKVSSLAINFLPDEVSDESLEMWVKPSCCFSCMN